MTEPPSDPHRALIELMKNDQRFKFDAYLFVRDGLAYAQDVLKMGTTASAAEKSDAAEVSGDDESELVPLHIAYHNAQLVLQNHLARTVVLPAFGIPFLDLETPLSVWRSGMVGSSAASPFRTPSSAAQQQHQQQAVLSSAGLRSPTSGDCTRYCFPSPGLAVERFFLGALATVFEAGWAGDAQREAKWMGEGFENVQDRHHAPRD